jgi:L-rhamnose-H+ transport protein
LKSKSQASDSDDQTVLTGGKLIKGLIVAVLSGVLCACYGIAVSFGGDVTNISVDQYGNPGWRAAFVLAALILWGGSLSACGYCVYKFCANKTWSTLTQPGIGTVLFIALIMACLHDGAILFFGVGVPRLGTQTFGAAIAYPVFMSFAIIVGNVNGFLTKEWKGASKQSMHWIIAGIIILIIGVSVFAKGSAMKGQYDKSHPVSTEGSQSRLENNAEGPARLH